MSPPGGRDEQGVVTLEMLFAFLPFLTMVLGILQLALMAATQLGVRHGATLAARAAAVAIDDAPRYYEGQMRGDINRFSGGGPWGEAERAIHPLFDGTPYLSRVGAGLGRRGSARLAEIQRAALWGVSPFAASGGSAESKMWFGWLEPPEGTSTGAHPPVLERFGAAFMGYARVATAVTFPDTARAGMQRVRVSYLFPCAIPLAGRLMCQSLGALEADGTLAEIRDNAELGSYIQLGDNAYYLVLSAEATLPRVDAPYLYREEL